MGQVIPSGGGDAKWLFMCRCACYIVPPHTCALHCSYIVVVVITFSQQCRERVQRAETIQVFVSVLKVSLREVLHKRIACINTAQIHVHVYVCQVPGYIDSRELKKLEK